MIVWYLYEIFVVVLMLLLCNKYFIYLDYFSYEDNFKKRKKYIEKRLLSLFI